MAWTATTRPRYERLSSRYASDMTEEEWTLIGPFMPACRHLGRPRTTELREVVNALLYIASTGCQWRMLPKDFPPPSTVQAYFHEWRDVGPWRTISNTLVVAAREQVDKQPGPTAGVIDSQSAKTTESGGIRGFDAGKKINGRKRHVVVDALGLMVGLVIHPAGIQDRDGAPDVLKTILERWPWLRHVFADGGHAVFADGGHAGPKLKGRLEKVGRFTLEIVKRTDQANGFEVIPRRWVVGRTFAWLGRCRRLAKDFEKCIASAEAWVYIANIRFLARRIVRN